jgi:Flp pilus assembly protein TadD
VQPAVEVFTKGSKAQPHSGRLLEGLGAALSASGAYEEAARHLCQDADLHPADPTPYLFLGKVEKAAEAALPCGEPTLARFAREFSGNAMANYYYAIAVWKRERTAKPATVTQAEQLLGKAVKIDPMLGEAYLQLGVVQAARGKFDEAITNYKKALAVSPQLGEAHYRLGSAYRRIGREEDAKRELEVYKQGEKIAAAERERQRREVQQFLIVLKDQPK